MASPRSRPRAWQPGRRFDLAIHARSWSWRTWILETGTIIPQTVRPDFFAVNRELPAESEAEAKPVQERADALWWIFETGSKHWRLRFFSQTGRSAERASAAPAGSGQSR